MEHQKFISNLSHNNANYNNPEQAITTANLCETISRDINTDSQRFIYELLQNADDASNHLGILDIHIEFVDKYIIVSHNGEPFSEVDIESISSAGDGTKTGDSNKTGFKGIGFKSVFSHSNFVIIKSGNYCFKFDKQHWSNHWNDGWGNENTWKLERKTKNKDENLKMPWQIIPIWTELPDKIKNLHIINEYKVSTIIRYDNIEKLKKALDDLFSESQIVLFLRSKVVKIFLNINQKLELEKNVSGDVTYIKRNGNILNEWLVKTEILEIPEKVQTEINADDKSPKKLKEAKRTEISFAIQLEKGKLKPVDPEKRLIFTYLPTSINYNLPFLVNASFLTDAGRQHLHIDTFWNQWLFNQIPILYFEWVSNLASKKSKFNKQFLTIVPQKLNGYNVLENKFNEGYDEALKTIAFIPNLQGDLLKISEALFDETNISEFLSKQTLIKYLNDESNKQYSISSFIPYLKPISLLKQLGLKIFKVENLESFFDSDIFSNEHQVEENFSLILFLYKQANNQNSENGNDWSYRLKNIPFIFDEVNVLQKPENLYFPSIEYTNDFISKISLVNAVVLGKINKDREIKKWLESLGVKEPTDINFIEKSIIGDENFITDENAIEIGKYLFNARNKLTEKHFSELQNIKLFTQKGELISAKDCYLSDIFEPVLKLEKFCNIDFFVSEDYYEEKDLKSDWQSFFLRLGLSDDIKWKKISIRPKLVDENDNAFFNQIPNQQLAKDYSFSGWPFNIWWFRVYHFSFFKLSHNNYEFSKLFWDRAFKSSIGNEKDFIYGTTGYYEGAFGAVHSIDIDNFTNTSYFKWTTENYNLFPTTNNECHCSCDIFNNSITMIHDIAGRYLPVLDFDGIISPEWQDKLNLKEQLKLDDYLNILTLIWKDTTCTEEEQNENKKRVILIYQKLAELYPNLHISDKNTLKEWGDLNKLLARDGKYYVPSELTIVTVEGFNADKLIYTENKVDESIISLFEIWGVKVIDKVIPKFSNSMISQESLRNQLEYIAPLIALVAVEKSKNRKEWEDEYNRILKRLSSITFFQTTEILLTYGNDQDQQHKSTYSEGNKFYYIGNWYKPRVLDGLIEPLCKFLNIRYVERILTVLVTDTFAEGLNYLEEKGFDISLIPSTFSDLQTQTSDGPDFSNRGYNISKEEIGKKGELLVYDYLKQIFKEKYGNIIIETNDGFKISNTLEVIWTNKNFTSKELYDFKVIEAGNEIFIDSKATKFSKYKEDVALYITVNEVKLMESASKYIIARVYEALSENPNIEFVRLTKDDLLNLDLFENLQSVATNNEIDRKTKLFLALKDINESFKI